MGMDKRKSENIKYKILLNISIQVGLTGAGRKSYAVRVTDFPVGGFQSNRTTLESGFIFLYLISTLRTVPGEESSTSKHSSLSVFIQDPISKSSKYKSAAS